MLDANRVIELEQSIQGRLRATAIDANELSPNVDVFGFKAHRSGQRYFETEMPAELEVLLAPSRSCSSSARNFL